MQPLIVRLLLDAQSEFARAADSVSSASRDVAGPGANAPGWIVAHAAFFLDAWTNVDARGLDAEGFDPWLLAWMDRQRSSAGRPVDTRFVDARSALGRVIERTLSSVSGLSDEDLARTPPRIVENGWPESTTIGYLVARSIAHLFAHAADLNMVTTAAGGPDLGLPGRLPHTLGAPAPGSRDAS